MAVETGTSWSNALAITFEDQDYRHGVTHIYTVRVIPQSESTRPLHLDGYLIIEPKPYSFMPDTLCIPLSASLMRCTAEDERTLDMFLNEDARKQIQYSRRKIVLDSAMAHRNLVRLGLTPDTIKNTTLQEANINSLIQHTWLRERRHVVERGAIMFSMNLGMCHNSLCYYLLYLDKPRDNLKYTEAPVIIHQTQFEAQIARIQEFQRAIDDSFPVIRIEPLDFEEFRRELPQFFPRQNSPELSIPSPR